MFPHSLIGKVENRCPSTRLRRVSAGVHQESTGMVRNERKLLVARPLLPGLSIIFFTSGFEHFFGAQLDMHHECDLSG